MESRKFFFRGSTIFSWRGEFDAGHLNFPHGGSDIHSIHGIGIFLTHLPSKSTTNMSIAVSGSLKNRVGSVIFLTTHLARKMPLIVLANHPTNNNQPENVGPGTPTDLFF